ncbi:NAD(P)-binding domain-containing protein [Dactylosporangium sp. NPDC050588]|uniref:flavin-containing monooxygenase n=1 Tax=Dactylosporangium sp. NPDC050588 TaxID=3157211 RepID=UPI0033F68070
MSTDVHTLVVGGGQAGLATGYHLRRAGIGCAVLDAHPRVGDAWRRRWDSLTLFTPRRFDALPGLAFPGDPDGHPGKDEVADYLAGYAEHFALPVHTGCAVTGLRPATDGGFVAETGTGEWTARQVVVAGGAFHTPSVPAVAARLAPSVVQLHSSDYRNPAGIPDGDVVVVGAGNTGVQIAAELAAAGRRVTIAYDELGPVLPQRLLGRDIFWWFSRLGTMGLSGERGIGARIRAQNPVIGTDVRGLLRTVRRTGRVVDAERDALVSADGTRHPVAAVVWATGFRPSYPWMHVPVLDGRGAPVHRGGVTDWPGLYFVGLPWQRARGSAVLGWVGRDAEVIAGHAAAAAGRYRTAVRTG